MTAVEVAARRLTVKTDAGPSVEVRAEEQTAFLKARPGSSTLDDAAPARLEDVAVGDRVLARGRLADDKASLAARQVVVMTRGDLTAKQNAERAEWRRRGILGVVSAVDPIGGEITLQARRMGGARPVVIAAAGPGVRFRRYAPDSVKFSDARPSALGDVRVGDQLRALAERSADGNRFVPEQIVFGTFRTVSGAVVRIDARGELTVRDEASPRPVRVAVGPDTRLRRFSIPTRFARDGGAGPEDMLELLPPITLAEIKPGDRVLVSSTKGSDPARLNAIALVAGLEGLGPPRAARGRTGRDGEGELPPELMDLGMSLP